MADPILDSMGGISSGSGKSLAGGLFARSFRVAVSPGLSWGGLLNTTPSTTVLMKECLIGFEEKTKQGGSRKANHWGGSRYALPKKEWIHIAYEMFRSDSWEFSRDFWIGQPLDYESELGTSNHVPACRSCGNKVMTYLLEVTGYPEGHGVRPRSLKDTTISALMMAVARGQANLSQVAIRGDYKAVAAQDMAKVYPRNIEQRKLSVPNFAQSAFQEKYEYRVSFSGPSGLFGWKGVRGHGFRNRISWIKTGWVAFKYSTENGSGWRFEKAERALRLPSQEDEMAVADEQVEIVGYARPNTAGEGNVGGNLILRIVEIECLNYRFSTSSFVDGETLLHILS